MRLQSVGLRGRRFLVQFYEIMREFGRVIPWLDGVEDIRFATNGAYFRDGILRRTRQRDGDITPYQFVESDDGRTFIGGMLHFTHSPERLADARNREVAERLTAEGASFISCLQIRPSLRAAGVGTSMMRRALRAILVDKGAVWGVVSNPHMREWYRSLGARTPSPIENRDGLWIVHWEPRDAAR